MWINYCYFNLMLEVMQNILIPNRWDCQNYKHYMFSQIEPCEGWTNYLLPTPGKGKGQSDAWKALYSHLNNNKKQFPVYKWSSENQMIFWSKGLGEMFEGDSADLCAGKFPLMLMGGWAEGLACADPWARTSLGVSGNLIFFFFHAPVTRIPEMVVVGFRNFAWAKK